MEILWNLQELSGRESNRYIVQCYHHDMLSSSPSNSATTPIISSRLTSLSFRTPITGLVLEQGGPTLSQYLEPLTAMPIRIQILREIVEAVQFLHNRKIVHLNLCPENIILSSNSGAHRWKLMDLSASCVVGTTVDRESLTSLNLEYSAPELVKILKQSPSVDHSRVPFPQVASPELDVWSLGMVAVFLLSGLRAWRLLYPDADFIPKDMIDQVWDDDDDNDGSTLKRLLACLEEGQGSAFIEQCLKTRSPCQDLIFAEIFQS
jgi:serine/threonine protein kinase